MTRFKFLPQFLFGIILLLFTSCATTLSQQELAKLPPHHTADGHFTNTDTLGGIIRDTILPDSLVASHRTETYALPIARGNEELWASDSISTATWIGQATYYLKLKGVGIITDPIFSERSSPVSFVGPKRANPPGRSLDSLPPIDIVILSHDHYDHLDKSSILDIHKKYPRAVFFTPLKVGEILRDWDIPDSLVFEKDWWEEVHYNELRFVCVPAHHTSRRGLFKSSRNSTLWAGWIVQQENRKLWFAGDIGMGNGSYYREIAKREGPMDLSLIPIGNYLYARYTSVHISPRQAVELHQLMQSRQSLAMHWGTFGMTYEEFEAPPKDLKRALEQKGVDESEFLVPHHGEIIKLDW